MLSDILFFPVTGPLKGVRWVTEKLRDRADEELYSVESVRARLRSLNEKLDDGRISEEEFREEEAVLLDLLDAAMGEGGDEPEQ